MHKNFIFAVDSGKSSTKGVMKEYGEIKKLKFRTLVDEVEDFGIETTPGSYLVSFMGKTYLIGDMLDESKFNYDLSKNSLQHKLSIYVAIAKLLEKSKQSIAFAKITLAINIPLSLYKNESHKKAYYDFICNNGEAICLTINNKSYVFSISNLLLLHEGMGPIYSDLNNFRNKRTLIIDVGSLNVNFLEFNNLIPNYQKMITADLGVNILRSKIGETLTSKYGTPITDSDVEQLFQDKYLYLYGEKQEDSKEAIDKITENHVTEIFNYAKSRKLSLNNIELVLVGGGSLLLKEFILKQYPSAILCEDPQFANALSFLRILESKYGQTA